VDRLGAAARRVLEAAALAGDGFTLDEVQPATALSEFEALDGLERALDARLLAAAEPGYRFVHDIARGAIDARLGPERRRRVHGRLAQGLIARHGRADRIARHLEGAGERGAAVPWRLQAADDAERIFARREAVAHLAAALDDGPGTADALNCHYRRATLLRSMSDIDACDAEIECYAAMADRCGDAGARYRVQLLRAMRLHDGARYDDALALLAALESLPAPTPTDRMNVLRLGGFTALHQDRGAMAERCLAGALAIAEEVQAPERIGIVANLVHLRVSAGATADAVATVDRAIARIVPADSLVEQAMLFTAAMRAYEAAGRRADARLAAAEALTRMRQAQMPHFIGNFIANRQRLEIEDGDLEAARASAAELDAVPVVMAMPYWRALNQARLHWAECRADEALTAARAACELRRGDPGAAANAHALQARYHALRGDLVLAC